MCDVCRVDGCCRAVKSSGLCNMHYKRVSRLGEVGEASPRKGAAGTGATRGDGYRLVTVGGVRRYEHDVVAEKALGHRLPSGAVVHHANGNPSDNRRENLVICQDDAYHKLLHLRGRSLEDCGNASWRRCSFCKSYSPPDEMYVGNKRAYHRECEREYQRGRRSARA